MKTIIFDLDDTLVAEEASAEAALRAACKVAHERRGVEVEALYTSIRESCCALWHNSPARAYCLDIGISSWEGLWAEFLGDDDNLRILAQWAPTYRQNSWQEALRQCGLKDDAKFARELGEIYVRERRKLHVVYDDVLPALEYFKQSYRLGLLTNGAPDLQRVKLKGSGLAPFFDTVVVSGEVGFGKPDTRIFELILKQLDAAPESAVMVGNSLKSDVAPALELGMTAVWVNRDGESEDKSIIPHAEVANLTKLNEILKDIFLD